MLFKLMAGLWELLLCLWSKSECGSEEAFLNICRMNEKQLNILTQLIFLPQNQRLEDCRIWMRGCAGVCHMFCWTETLNNSEESFFLFWLYYLVFLHIFFTEPLFRFFFQHTHSSVRDKTWQISKLLISSHHSICWVCTGFLFVIMCLKSVGL